MTGGSGGISGTAGSGGGVVIAGSGGSVVSGGSGGRMATGASGGVTGAAGAAGRAGTDGTGGRAGAAGSGATAGAGGSVPGSPFLSVCPNCTPLFDGVSLAGWIQVPASSWSVVNGAMHSLGPARGFIYTSRTYGDFRFIFTSRLVADPANHLPCVLFWGNSPTRDALSAIQVQPPNGYMWDYRTTGPTANMSPDRFEMRFAHPAVVDTQWNQCEMLGNQATGTMRFACCQTSGTTPCKAAEVVDFTDASAGLVAPLAFQVHNAGMIEEFKDVYVESPVADPSVLLTTR
jgi:hypothetical protein